MEDKKTLRDHLRSLWRQTRIEPEQLAKAAKLPDLAAHLWVYFVAIDRERGSGVAGINPITSRIIKDWCWASGNKLLLWERNALLAIDAVRIEVSQNGR